MRCMIFIALSVCDAYLNKILSPPNRKFLLVTAIDLIDVVINSQHGSGSKFEKISTVTMKNLRICAVKGLEVTKRILNGQN